MPAMRRLGAAHDLIVCVDCGTLSHEPIAAAGCDVIVLDHHLGAETLPPALAVVNPNRQDEDGDLGYLCAAGGGLPAARRRQPADARPRAAGPDLLGFLDLVALATVADVAPLTGLNRALVRQGLAVMARARAAGHRRAGRRRRADRRAAHLRPRLRARAAGQRRRADRRGRPRRAAPRRRRPARGRRARRAARRAQRRAAGDRGGGAGAGRGAGGGARRRRPAGLGGRRGLAPRRRRHRRGAAQGGLRPAGGGDRPRRRPGQGLGPLGRRRRPRRRGRAAGRARPDLARRRAPHGGGPQPLRHQLQPAMARLGALLAGPGAGERPGARASASRRSAPAAPTAELAAAIAAAGPYGAGAPAPRLAVVGAAPRPAGGSAPATSRSRSPSRGAGGSTPSPSAPPRCCSAPSSPPPHG